MSLTVSILQGGTNSHTTTSEEVNYLATDLLSQGINGTLTNTSGVAPATGGFAVNAQGTPNMTVAVSAGTAYVTGTPTSGNSQLFRVKNSASTNVTISSNSTGGTRYDWVYIKLDPDKLKDPAVDASDVATMVTSRSTSASTDNGTPPTYGYCVAVVTVANGASSIDNASIADSRVNAGIPTAKINDSAVTYAKLLATIFSGQVTSAANAGTWGGTNYYINLGGIKLCWGISAAGTSIAAGGNSSKTVTLPTSFFSTVSTAYATTLDGGGSYENWILSSVNVAPSTTTLTIKSTNTGAGASGTTYKVYWLVIGT